MGRCMIYYRYSKKRERVKDVKLKENDFVQVKSFEEIRKTLDVNWYHKKMFFHPEMMELCSKTFKVKAIIGSNPSKVRLVKVDGSGLPLKDQWSWHADWLKKIK